MALPPTEIWYSKYAPYHMAGAAVVIVAPLSGVLIAVHTRWEMYLLYIVCVGIIALMAFRFFRKFFFRKPVLVLESDALTINQRGSKIILWSEITEWKIKIYKSNKRLFIRTSSGKVNVTISMLDRPVREITELLETYIREPGPGGVKRDKLPILVAIALLAISSLCGENATAQTQPDTRPNIIYILTDG